MVFTIKVGDTLPALQATLSTELGPVDLTTATAVWLVLSQKVAATLTEAATTTLVFRKAGSVVGDPTNGQVKYAWADGDTDTAGRYIAEFEINFGSAVWTFPTVGTIPITILEDND